MNGRATPHLAVIVQVRTIDAVPPKFPSAHGPSTHVILSRLSMMTCPSIRSHCP